MKSLLLFVSMFVVVSLNSTVQAEGIHTAQGIMVGEVTDQSAVVQVRLTATDKPVKKDVAGVAGVVRFSLQTRKGGAVTLEAKAVADHDHIARVRFTDLKPGIRYECSTQIGATKDSMEPGPTASFRTLPGADSEKYTQFVVVTGMNYAKFHGDDRIDRKQHLVENNTELPKPYAGKDKALGYPGLASILKLKPHFFIGTGDNVYYDTPDNPRAKTVPELRQKWHEQFSQPRFRDLFAAVPTYWEIDDHDYRIDDGDNSGDYEPTPETAQRLVREQLPFAPHGTDVVKTYRTHRVNKHLQLWFVENRMYRSDNASPDCPEKTIWGAEQTAWLKKTLKESDATFKLLISPTPMVGPDDLRKTDNHTNHGGFRNERDQFFKWVKESSAVRENFYIVCGDRHWQYHAVDSSGIEELSCGALVDANSRLGRQPGDPKSTDPDGLIKQPYMQNPRSGGFLQIRIAPKKEDRPVRLTCIWHDENGEVLHRFQKPVE